MSVRGAVAPGCVPCRNISPHTTRPPRASRPAVPQKRPAQTPEGPPNGKALGPTGTREGHRPNALVRSGRAEQMCGKTFNRGDSRQRYCLRGRPPRARPSSSHWGQQAGFVHGEPETGSMYKLHRTVLQPAEGGFLQTLCIETDPAAFPPDDVDFIGTLRPDHIERPTERIAAAGPHERQQRTHALPEIDWLTGKKNLHAG